MATEEEFQEWRKTQFRPWQLAKKGAFLPHHMQAHPQFPRETKMKEEDLNKAACDLTPEKLQAFYKESTGKDMPIEFFQKIKQDIVCPHLEIIGGTETMVVPGISYGRDAKRLKEIEAGFRLETIKNLQKSVNEEQQAQRDYLHRADVANGAGDQATAELFRHVASEERQHEQEFTGRFYDEYK